MRVIIAGSRTITDTAIVNQVIANALNGRAAGIAEIDTVLSGCARGVDQLGEAWARAHCIPVERYPANWAKHGKAAGPIRNGEMVARADALIAVQDGGSRGTADVIRQARARGLRVWVERVE